MQAGSDRGVPDAGVGASGGTGSKEFDRISHFLRPLAGHGGALGLQDDAALIAPPPGMAFAVTKDAIVESVHFLPGTDPFRLAQKLVRVNFSDLAAMGAEPYGYFTALSLPESCDDAWMQAFAAGLQADQEQFGASLMGGDLTSTPGPLTLSLTAMGCVPCGEDGTAVALRRNAACAGDDLWITGTIGDAAFGLPVAQGRLFCEDPEQRDWLAGRYERPRPRLASGRALRDLVPDGLVHAAMDVSDGLAGDLEHMARASGVHIRIDAMRVPLSPAVASLLADDPDGGMARVLCGGDDYELAFTAPPESRERLEALSVELAGLEDHSLDRPFLTRIGRVTEPAPEAPLVLALDRDGEPLPFAGGYCHFR